MSLIVYLIPVLGIFALLYMVIVSVWVNRQDAGTDRMKTIAGYISEGAMAFLKAEYLILGIYVVIASILLGWLSTTNDRSDPTIVIAFIIGAIFSGLAGFIGMKIATKANVRTTQAARTSLSKALQVSFAGGSVMGLGVAGLAALV